MNVFNFSFVCKGSFQFSLVKKFAMIRIGNTSSPMKVFLFVALFGSLFIAF